MVLIFPYYILKKEKKIKNFEYKLKGYRMNQLSYIQIDKYI